MTALNSIQSLLKHSSKKLENVSDSPVLDAELLMSFCIEKNRTYLHTWPEIILDPQQCTSFNSLIEKRLTDYPIAYILGSKPFWTMDLIVTPDVLIPRPETELLVEVALDKISKTDNPKILDLGTGSGAVALALASERPDAIIFAVDNSEKALVVARKNTINLKLESQISFIKSDWVENINETKFDLVVSNPPYIDPEDNHLNGTIRFEPLQALIANDQGMSDIKKIITTCHPLIAVGGWLILEHGYDQAEKTLKSLSLKSYSKNQNYQDLNGNWRVTSGQKSA